MTTKNEFSLEVSGSGPVCGNALSTPGGGYCKDRGCGQPSSTLLDGYCMPCAIKRGLNPLISCGCKPIKLTREAADAS